MENSILINNAGLVIMHPYLKLLFERAGYSSNGEFKDEDAQHTAILYSQFLATGYSTTNEVYLPLNKILCGVDLKTPVNTTFELTKNLEELGNGLLNAVIQHWSAIGNASYEVLRGNFIIRDGKLIESDEKWNLEVESKPYDVLLDKLPWSISQINLPWMEKPLEVKWRN